MPNHVLRTGPYFQVEIDMEAELVRLTRNGTPYRDVRSACADWEQLGEFLRFTPARRLLVDLRGSPPSRLLDDLVVAMRRPRLALEGRFARVAVLVRSAAGRLQINRLIKEEGSSGRVFLEEPGALEYLAAD